MAHVEKLVSFSPRPAGSEQMAKAADYVCRQLQDLGLQPQRDEYLDPQEKLLLRNVWVQIDGEDPQKGPILVLGAHYDTKKTEGHPEPAHNFPFMGAIDGSGGPAVLLEVARVLTKDPKYKPKVNVWLLFIDGEEAVPWDWGKGEQAMLGSKHFVKMMAEDKKLFPDGLTARMKAFVLLDLIGSKDFKLDRDLGSNKALQDFFEKAGKAIGQSDRVYEFTSQIMGDDHFPFRDRGVPSVDLIDFEFRIPFHLRRGPRGEPFDPKAPRAPRDDDFKKWWHSADDKIENMSPEALAFVGNLVLQAWPDLEAFCRK
jgi:Zn-dependent M28 family amino/carboxypeptidase